MKMSELGSMVRFQPKKASEQIRKALESNGGEVLSTAADLGVSRECLYRWLRMLKLQPDLKKIRRAAG